MPRKPKSPRPIKPLTKHSKAYELAMQDTYLKPFLNTMESKLGTVVAADQAYQVMDDVVGKLLAQPRGGVSLPHIQAALDKMQGYHKDRVIRTFRAALGVDVRPYLQDILVNDFMRTRVAENVDLIKTIPPRFKDGLAAKVQQTFFDEPFNQQAMKKLFAEEGKSAGYNLKRITRDQNNKLTGQLTQIRQQQLGIQAYHVADQ